MRRDRGGPMLTNVDRHELQRRVDAELDRDERELITDELSSGEGWTQALEAAQVGAPLTPPLVQAMLHLFRTVIPRRHQERRARFMLLVHRAINRLEDEIDLTRTERASFVRLAEQIRDRIERPESEGKHEYYAAALVRSMTPLAPEAVDQAAMIAILDELRPAHLQLIAVMRTAAVHPPEQREMLHNTPAVLARRITGMTAEQIGTHFSDLLRHSIVPMFDEPPSMPRSPYALANAMTRFGIRFADWISPVEPADGVAGNG